MTDQEIGALIAVIGLLSQLAGTVLPVSVFAALLRPFATITPRASPGDARGTMTGTWKDIERLEKTSGRRLTVSGGIAV